MPSRSITLRGEGPDISTRMFPALHLGDHPHWIGLVSLYTHNTVINVREGRNTFTYYPKRVAKVTDAPPAEGESILHVETDIAETVTLPSGSYSLSDISKYLFKEVLLRVGSEAWNSRLNYFNMYASNVTHAVLIETSMRIDFTVKNSIGPLLGFSRVLRPPVRPGKTAKFQSDKEAELLKDHLVFVNCNLVSEAVHNEKPSHSIYSFTVNESAGYAIDEKPSHVLYHLVDRRSVSEVTIELRTQDGRPLPLKPGTQVDVTLYLKS